MLKSKQVNTQYKKCSEMVNNFMNIGLSFKARLENNIVKINSMAFLRYLRNINKQLP